MISYVPWLNSALQQRAWGIVCPEIQPPSLQATSCQQSGGFYRITLGVLELNYLESNNQSNHMEEMQSCRTFKKPKYWISITERATTWVTLFPLMHHDLMPAVLTSSQPPFIKDAKKSCSQKQFSIHQSLFPHPLLPSRLIEPLRQ